MPHKQRLVARVLVLVEQHSQRDSHHMHHTQPNVNNENVNKSKS